MAHASIPLSPELAEAIREAKASTLIHAVRLEAATRLKTLDTLRRYLRHDDGCVVSPCDCGLTYAVTILEAGSVAS